MATMLGLGELLWDVFPDGKRPGGAPANFAFHAAQLGHDAAVISRVGEDQLGNELLIHLKTNDISTELVQIDDQKPTGAVQVEVAPDGTPKFTVVENEAWDYLEDQPRLHKAVASADVVCFGTLTQRGEKSRKTVKSLLNSAKNTVLFDINLRKNFWSKQLVEAGLTRATIAKMNQREQQILKQLGLGKGDRVDWCRSILLEFRLELVCVTRGKNGCLLVGTEVHSEHPGYPVEVADTVGCGDAFAAGVAHCYLRGYPLDKTADFANRVGSFVASRPGATPPLPEALRLQ
jgi:fructokinase